MKHGLNNTYFRGCRCTDCREAVRIYIQSDRAKARSLPTPEHAHGTRNGYSRYGCRCEECKAANTHAMRAYRRGAK